MNAEAVIKNNKRCGIIENKHNGNQNAHNQIDKAFFIIRPRLIGSIVQITAEHFNKNQNIIAYQFGRNRH